MLAARMGALCMICALGVSACTHDAPPQLMNSRKSSARPDEFSILPTRALTQPDDYTLLPVPTPGGRNRADREPITEAMQALGGDGAGAGAGAGVSTDAALLAAAGRYGIAPGIRAVVAAEDLDYRRRHRGRLLERVFRVNVYFRAYRPQTLDSRAESDRLRRAGVQVATGDDALTPPPGAP